MRRTATRLIVVLGVLVLALSVGACGSKKKKKMEDPVATALMTPGLRMVTIPKQRADLTIVVPPCSSASVQQDASRKPPGSNEVVIPKGSLTQTVAVPPCQKQPMQSAANTVLVTPGGTATAAGEAGTASELVVPDNSDLRTIIVPPCTTGDAESKPKSFAFPATTRKKSVTAPPCTAPPATPKK